LGGKKLETAGKNAETTERGNFSTLTKRREGLIGSISAGEIGDELVGKSGPRAAVISLQKRVSLVALSRYWL